MSLRRLITFPVLAAAAIALGGCHSDTQTKPPAVTALPSWAIAPNLFVVDKIYPVDNAETCVHATVPAHPEALYQLVCIPWKDATLNERKWLNEQAEGKPMTHMELLY